MVECEILRVIPQGEGVPRWRAWVPPGLPQPWPVNLRSIWSWRCSSASVSGSGCFPSSSPGAAVPGGVGRTWTAAPRPSSPLGPLAWPPAPISALQSWSLLRPCLGSCYPQAWHFRPGLVGRSPSHPSLREPGGQEGSGGVQPLPLAEWLRGSHSDATASVSPSVPRA